MMQPLSRVTCLLSTVGMLVGLSADATVLKFTASLDGLTEFPPNASPGTGAADLYWDTDAATMTLDVAFSGLLGTTTAAHIHGPTASPDTGTAGVATQTPFFVGFPIGVTSGTYAHTFDLTDPATYNGSFLTGAGGGTPAGAAAALLAALQADKAYLNIHTSAFGGGEIRGFLHEVAVPDGSSTAPLLVVACLGLWGLRRRTHGS